MPYVRTFDGLDDLSRAAADELGRIAREAIVARGVCHVALSGGSTPKKLFELLAAKGADALPWPKLHLWWGDERTVPPEHADSNYGMTRRALIAPLGLADARVHRIAGELPDHDAAAAAYERELLAAVGSPPVLDLALQGMGPDGHTASLFPGTSALGETERWVVANHVDSPVTKGPTVRITMTARAINAARHVRFLVAGADKATVLEQVLEGPRDPTRYPSQLIEGADVLWFVDRAAGARLGGAA